METFYYIGIKREKNEALIQSLIEYEQIKLKRAEIIPAEPFKMEINEGHTLYDIVGFQDTSNFAISEKLFNLLKKHSITGWKAYEISIKGVKEKYYGFQVLGRCEKLEEPKEAFLNNIQFYKEENGIWLSDQIPSKYIVE
ncbi:hypothetical protein [Flexibacter flexilis]|nr:hypothetical protein [Flexibacter flexilis]